MTRISLTPVTGQQGAESQTESPAGKGMASGSHPARGPRAPAGRVERGKPEEQSGDAMTVLEFLPYSGSLQTS